MPAVPSAFAMTRRMLDAVEENGAPKRVRHAVRIAVASLQFGIGLRDERPHGEVNIEEVVNVLSTLEHRHALEAAALIGAWHPIVEDLDRVTVQPNPPRFQGFGSSDVLGNLENERATERQIERVVRAVENAVSRRSLDTRELRDALGGLMEGRKNRRIDAGVRPANVATPQAREIPGMGKVYGNARRFLVGQLKSLAWVGDEVQLGYLDPLVECAGREHFTIATLNYDNTIELVARRLGIRLDTGIGFWREKGTFGFGDYEAVPYRKLHGSINWAMHSEESQKRTPLTREVLTEVSEERMRDAEHEPALIFGGRNKLTVRGPFLDLLLDFRDRLRVAKNLVVIGYSFGDDHINEYIAQWLNAMPEATLTIVNGPNFSSKAAGFAKRLSLVGAPRVIDTGKYAEEGIAELFCAEPPR
jgi:hypothetical protein